MEKPPATLRDAEPAPSLTTSDNSGVLISRPNALAVASPSAAKPEAEKPSPLPLTSGFLDSILAFVDPKRDDCRRWLTTANTLSCSLRDGDLPFILIRSSVNSRLNATVVIVGSAFMQTDMLSWYGSRSLSFRRPWYFTSP